MMSLVDSAQSRDETRRPRIDYSSSLWTLVNWPSPFLKLIERKTLCGDVLIRECSSFYSYNSPRILVKYITIFDACSHCHL
jgi:hypothetical protein